jgi:hypothetical protein
MNQVYRIGTIKLGHSKLKTPYRCFYSSVLMFINVIRIQKISVDAPTEEVK